MIDQETIERAVIGKRVVAVAWLPIPALEDAFQLESITLEGGTKLNLDYWIKPDFEKIVIAEIEEGEDANI